MRSPTNLRLFKLVRADGQVLYYDNKRVATNHRDVMRDKGYHVFVGRGPDHRRGESK